jgi:hypothetical protein
MLGEELGDQGADFPVVVYHEKVGLLVHGPNIVQRREGG